MYPPIVFLRQFCLHGSGCVHELQAAGGIHQQVDSGTGGTGEDIPAAGYAGQRLGQAAHR